jgi:hypothetical protein
MKLSVNSDQNGEGENQALAEFSPAASEEAAGVNAKKGARLATRLTSAIEQLHTLPGPEAEGCYQYGMPRDTTRRNFVPKRDLTRYDN